MFGTGNIYENKKNSVQNTKKCDLLAFNNRET